MARRAKPSGCKKIAQSRGSCQRASGTREKVRSILIASEDTESSVIYFKLILKDLKEAKSITPFSCVFASHGHTNPSGVLDDLLNHTESNGDTYEDFDHHWIVIDRDKQWTAGSGHKEHDFKEALSSAKEKGVEVAYSNDSFELWYLLHFNYECSAMSREDVNAKLKELELSGSNISIKSKGFVEKIYPYLVEKEAEAIRNAKNLLNVHAEAGTEPSEANPSTTVHKLVSFLRGGSE